MGIAVGFGSEAGRSVAYGARKASRASVGLVVCVVVALVATVLVHGPMSRAEAAPYDCSPSGGMYLIIGQSNAGGRGEVPPLVLDGVSLFNGTEFVPATPNMNEYSTLAPNTGYNLGYTFANAMRQVTGQEIEMVVNARGGSSINSWLPDASPVDGIHYFQSTVERVNAALAASDTQLAGIIWHQGERDRHSPDTYAGKLAELVEAFRKEFNSPLLPFVAGELSYEYVGDDGVTFMGINETLNGISDISNFSVASADGVGVSHDKVHFSVAGYAELGNRYAEEMLALHGFTDIGDRPWSPPSGSTLVPTGSLAGDFFEPKPGASYTLTADTGFLLASDGEGGPFSVTADAAVASEVSWQFVDAGNGMYHLDLAAGGTYPRLYSAAGERLNASITSTSNNADSTYFELSETSPGSGTYFVDAVEYAAQPGNQRLFADGGKIAFGVDDPSERARFTITETAAPVGGPGPSDGGSPGSLSGEFEPEVGVAYTLTADTGFLLAGDGEGGPFSVTADAAVASEVSWEFVPAEKAGMFHLDLAAGGTYPRLYSAAGERLHVSMTLDANYGPATYFRLSETSPGAGTYFVDAVDFEEAPGNQRLFADGGKIAFGVDDPSERARFTITETAAPVATPVEPAGFEPEVGVAYTLMADTGFVLASDGESAPFSVEPSEADPAEAQWKFVDAGDGMFHLDLAAGGTYPRLYSAAAERLHVSMTLDTNYGTATYFKISETSPGAGTYFIDAVDFEEAPENQRLFADGGKIAFGNPGNTQPRARFTITETISLAPTGGRLLGDLLPAVASSNPGAVQERARITLTELLPAAAGVWDGSALSVAVAAQADDDCDLVHVPTIGDPLEPLEPPVPSVPVDPAQEAYRADLAYFYEHMSDTSGLDDDEARVVEALAESYGSDAPQVLHSLRAARVLSNNWGLYGLEVELPFGIPAIAMETGLLLETLGYEESTDPNLLVVSNDRPLLRGALAYLVFNGAFLNAIDVAGGGQVDAYWDKDDLTSFIDAVSADIEDGLAIYEGRQFESRLDELNSNLLGLQVNFEIFDSATSDNDGVITKADLSYYSGSADGPLSLLRGVGEYALADPFAKESADPQGHQPIVGCEVYACRLETDIDRFYEEMLDTSDVTDEQWDVLYALTPGFPDGEALRVLDSLRAAKILEANWGSYGRYVEGTRNDPGNEWQMSSDLIAPVLGYEDNPEPGAIAEVPPGDPELRGALAYLLFNKGFNHAVDAARGGEVDGLWNRADLEKFIDLVEGNITAGLGVHEQLPDDEYSEVASAYLLAAMVSFEVFEQVESDNDGLVEFQDLEFYAPRDQFELLSRTSSFIIDNPNTLAAFDTGTSVFSWQQNPDGRSTFGDFQSASQLLDFTPEGMVVATQRSAMINAIRDETVGGVKNRNFRNILMVQHAGWLRAVDPAEIVQPGKNDELDEIYINIYANALGDPGTAEWLAENTSVEFTRMLADDPALYDNLTTMLRDDFWFDGSGGDDIDYEKLLVYLEGYLDGAGDNRDAQLEAFSEAAIGLNPLLLLPGGLERKDILWDQLLFQFEILTVLENFDERELGGPLADELIEELLKIYPEAEFSSDEIGDVATVKEFADMIIFAGRSLAAGPGLWAEWSQFQQAMTGSEDPFDFQNNGDRFQKAYASGGLSIAFALLVGLAVALRHNVEGDPFDIEMVLLTAIAAASGVDGLLRNAAYDRAAAAAMSLETARSLRAQGLNRAAETSERISETILRGSTSARKAMFAALVMDLFILAPQGILLYFSIQDMEDALESGNDAILGLMVSQVGVESATVVLGLAKFVVSMGLLKSFVGVGGIAKLALGATIFNFASALLGLAVAIYGIVLYYEYQGVLAKYMDELGLVMRPSVILDGEETYSQAERVRWWNAVFEDGPYWDEEGICELQEAGYLTNTVDPDQGFCDGWRDTVAPVG